MKITEPIYYKDFKCIAGECPDSCCQGWEVDADEKSLEFYKSLSPDSEIRKRIDSVLDKDEFDNTIFTLAPKKRCPFLNSENLCDMHLAIGGEHTPYTCRTFPRFIYDFGGTREIGISFSCPVASDMIYDFKGHITFTDTFNADPPTLNDIDAEDYFTLLKARGQAFKIAQDDTVTIPQRLDALLNLATDVQPSLGEYREGGQNIEFFDIFKNPELINPEWSKKVNNAVIGKISNSNANENIIVYFIYKYFMQAVYDKDLISKIKMAVVGVLINTYFGEDSWTIHLWSKETEHSQYNMDRYVKLLHTAECLTVNALKKMISL